jgi:hypothetical protein
MKDRPYGETLDADHQASKVAFGEAGSALYFGTP